MKGQVKEFKKELLSVAYTLLTLLIIRNYPKPVYGYKIIQLVNSLSNGKIMFKEGTLYPILKKLSKLKLLNSFWEVAENGPPKKYYTITELGEKCLEELLSMWNDTVYTINMVKEKVERGEFA